MQSITTGIEPKRQSNRGRLAFIVLLLLSPILPYVLTTTYNSFMFARAGAEIALLPSYPGAQLVNPYPFSSADRCLERRLTYVTTAVPEHVRIYYESALPRAGWHRSDGPTGDEWYAKSTTKLRVRYDNEGYIYITVIAKVFPLFDLRCFT